MGKTEILIIVVFFLLGGVSVTPVSATPSSSAQARSKATYKIGVTLFKARKFKEAIREFNKAYRDSPSPTLMYNIARSFEELGEYRMAIESYKEYLKAAPEASDQERVARTLTTLERLEATTKTDADLLVESTPVGAEVTLDGKVVGKTPLNLTVKPGTHAVRITQTGFQSVTVNHNVVARRASTLSLALRPTEVVRVAQETPGWLPWALIGTGGLAVVTGSVAFLIGQGAADEAEGLRANRQDLDRYYELREDHAKAFGIGITGVGLGALVLTGGLVLILNEGADSTGVSLSPGGVVWGGRF